MLSDDDLSLILEAKARKLENGDKTRHEVTKELAQLVSEDIRDLYDEDYVNHGPLQSQGRASFGRANEGVEGTALFLPLQFDE